MQSVRTLSGIGCLLILAGFAWAGLSPFDPTPENRVGWEAESPGLHFERGVVIGSVSPAQASGCTIQFWMRPASNRGSSVLIDFYEGGENRRLGIEQDGNREVRFSRRTARSIERLRVEFVVVPGNRLLVTATLGPDGARLYLDSALVAESASFRSVPGDCSGPFTLGTGAASDSTWRGDLLGLAVYGRALDAAEIGTSRGGWDAGEVRLGGPPAGPITLYVFDQPGDAQNRLSDLAGGGGDLHIPTAFAVPLDRFLYAPTFAEIRADGLEWDDILVNVFGFAPLGFCLYPFLGSFPRFRRAAALESLVLGLGTSLTIETLQYWLPTRTSSLVDVLTNVMGTGLGVVFAAASLAVLAGSRSSTAP